MEVSCVLYDLRGIRIKQYYRRTVSTWKTRVFFSEENVVIRISYPRNNEELQQLKFSDDDIRAYIVDEFNFEYSFPSRIDSDILETEVNS